MNTQNPFVAQPSLSLRANRLRALASYAERHGLFRVADGFTSAYYVKLQSVGLVHERVGGDDDLPIHSTRGIDPTKSEKATPVGVLGPFEHEAEAEAARLAITELFPGEPFDIYCLEIASGIFLPMKLPKQQELARQKAAALTSQWRHIGGMVRYYTLSDATKPRVAPFDDFGPFPDANSMRDAMERLAAKFPEMNIASRNCGFADDLISDAELTAEYARTLEKLAAQGA